MKKGRKGKRKKGKNKYLNNSFTERKINFVVR